MNNIQLAKSTNESLQFEKEKKSVNGHNANRAVPYSHLWLCLFPKLHAFYSHISFLIHELSSLRKQWRSSSTSSWRRDSDHFSYLWRRITWLAWQWRRQILGTPQDQIFAIFIDSYFLNTGIKSDTHFRCFMVENFLLSRTKPSGKTGHRWLSCNLHRISLKCSVFRRLFIVVVAALVATRGSPQVVVRGDH